MQEDDLKELEEDRLRLRCFSGAATSATGLRPELASERRYDSDIRSTLLGFVQRPDYGRNFGHCTKYNDIVLF